MRNASAPVEVLMGTPFSAGFCGRSFNAIALTKRVQGAGKTWQATAWPPRPLISAGSVIVQISFAYGQRGWKLHPGGGLSGLGTSPGSLIRSVRAAASIVGIADRNARVYGWRGAAKISSRLAISTILPRYI